MNDTKAIQTPITENLGKLLSNSGKLLAHGDEARAARIRTRLMKELANAPCVSEDDVTWFFEIFDELWHWRTETTKEGFQRAVADIVRKLNAIPA